MNNNSRPPPAPQHRQPTVGTVINEKINEMKLSNSLINTVILSSFD